MNNEPIILLKMWREKTASKPGELNVKRKTK